MKTEITDTMVSCLQSVIFMINSSHKGYGGDRTIYEVQFSEVELKILSEAVEAYYDARRKDADSVFD